MAGKYLLCNDAERTDIFESEEMEKAWAILFADKERTFSVVQISPAVRVAIGEKFGMNSGEDCMGKIATALCAMGADAVVDSAMGGDIMAIADAKSLLARKEKGVNKPLFSSKCAFVADYIRAKYPDIEVSESASEDSVNAVLLKEYYKEQTGKTVRVISVEPCKAKKFLLGVDVVITADELESMLVEVEEVGVSVRTLKKRILDMPLGVPSGGAYITEFSGGMAEAVARSLKKDNDVAFVQKLSYGGFYGLKSRREARVEVDGKTFDFAIACGLDEAETLIKEVREGKSQYDYIEITVCQGGCVCGTELAQADEDKDRLRRKGLQSIDKKRSARVPSANLVAKEMKKRYDAWLRKKKAGQIEDEPDVEPVVIDEEYAVSMAQPAPVAEIVEPEKLEIVEEVVEPIVEELATEIIEEIAIAEEIIEEVEEIEETEEIEESRKADPYYQRMSKKDRRKMKRANKKK